MHRKGESHIINFYHIIISKGIILIGFLTIFSSASFAQDIQFSQFFASSMYLNPAFTGNTIQHRWIGIYRNQWPSIPGAFVSYSFSYDNHLSKLNSGVGLIVTQDKAGSGGLRFTNVGGLYSYYFQVNRNLTVRFGTKLSYTFRNYDQSKLRFQDQIITGSPATIEKLNEGTSYPDFNVGTIIYSHKYWFGFAFDHINRPDQSFLSQETNLPIKWSIHGGYKFTLNEGDAKGKGGTYLSPSINYKAQEKWDQLDIGASINKNALTFGLAYRGIPFFKRYKPGFANNDAIILLVGVQANNLKIGYSYDITISKLGGNTGGAHEISITYEHHRKKKRRKRFFAPCAKF
jgi:type IX secretion system PorP/SprF family membrane protein